MVKTENFEKILITKSSQLRDWLIINHSQIKGIWLVTYKASIKELYVSNSDILDELLCFGWIDGIKRKIDDQTVMQLITPRRVQHWSKTYKDRFSKLEKEGKVMPSGLQSVIVSKSSGLWNYMDDVDALIKPNDLILLMNLNPPSMQNFDSFGASSKRFMLRYIKIAKTEVTRNKRIQEVTLLAMVGKKLEGS
jgi:uncharacterized protein YdeI (YjbR/CyaY-like superfamily)